LPPPFLFRKIREGRFNIEKKKMGRPTESPKGNYTGIRLSDDEDKKLNFCMTKTGMTKTDVLRRGIDLVYQEITRK